MVLIKPFILLLFSLLYGVQASGNQFQPGSPYVFSAFAGASQEEVFPPAVLLAEYLFDGNGDDTSTNGFHLVNSGGVVFTNGFSEFNNASYLYNTNMPANAFEYHSFSFWGKLKNYDGSFFTLRRRMDLQAGDGYELFYTTFGSITLFVLEDTGGVQGSTSSLLYSNAPPVTNQWYHFAGTVSKDKTEIFINNEVAYSGGFGIPVPTNYNVLGLGFFGTNNSIVLDGFIDNFRLYRGTLTPSEIQTLYNEGHD